MSILLTGAAGFIGFHVAKALLDRGDQVVGIDNLNDYYDVRLKEARLDQLRAYRGFAFARLDVADRDGIFGLVESRRDLCGVIHLAAQAGVRYSLENPAAYVRSNLMGHLNLMELARHRRSSHLVYASSSSVYGGNTSLPFRVEDRVDRPLSMYAATKRSDELMSETMDLARRIAKMPVASLSATKRVVIEGRIDAVRAARAREDRAFTGMIGQPANMEAITAFLEKREPDFSRL